MSSETILIILGFLVWVSPFVGLPIAILSWVIPLCGLGIVALSYHVRAKARNAESNNIVPNTL
jgi:hypothetical protein